MNYNKQEIQEHFNDSIINYDKEWIEKTIECIHDLFNMVMVHQSNIKQKKLLNALILNVL